MCEKGNDVDEHQQSKSGKADLWRQLEQHRIIFQELKHYPAVQS